METSPAPANHQSTASPLIKIAAVGGAGLNALRHFAQTDLSQIPSLAFHTNARSLSQSEVRDQYLIGSKRLRGLGSGGDPMVGQAAAEEEAPALQQFFQNTDLLFIVAGLGGGTGSGAGPVIARQAKEAGALVLAFTLLPFEFEGPRRRQQAHASLQQWKSAADAVVCLANQKIVGMVDENTSVLDAFKITNDLLTQSVRSLWQMLTRPALISLNFADVCSALRGRHSETALATAEAQGENRSRELIEKLLASPWLAGGHDLAEAEALLVSFSGGPDLTMSEVNRLLTEFNRHSENAEVFLGATIDPALTGKLAVTLLASRRQKRSDDSEAEVEMPSSRMSPEIETQFLSAMPSPRPSARFIPPPPDLNPENAGQLLQGKKGIRAKKAVAQLRQGQLPLEIISKGRFEKSEPTIHHGEDLDVPTYIRRGVPLN